MFMILGSFPPLSFCRKAMNIIISTSVYKPTYFYLGYINESGMNIISSYDLEFHKMQNLGDNQRWCLASWPKNKRARWAQVWKSRWQLLTRGEDEDWVLLSNIAFIIIIICFVIIITTTHLSHQHDALSAIRIEEQRRSLLRRKKFFKNRHSYNNT